MKVFIAAFLLLFSSLVAGENIDLFPDHGTFKVTTVVNGVVPVLFLVDTGASMVSIPFKLFEYLVFTGTLSKEDIIGKDNALLADGSTIEILKFYIRHLKIGTRDLYNVVGSTTKGDSTLFLLGQSALQQLEPWKFDSKTNQLILEDQPTSAASVTCN